MSLYLFVCFFFFSQANIDVVAATLLTLMGDLGLRGGRAFVAPPVVAAPDVFANAGEESWDDPAEEARIAANVLRRLEEAARQGKRKRVETTQRYRLKNRLEVSDR